METAPKAPDRARFQRDVAWNVGGLAVAALAGIGLNTAIGSLYGAEALGVFNQAFAVFVFASQLGVLGIHHSVLKHVAATQDDREIRDINTAALILGAAVALVVAGLMALSAHPVAALVDSEAVARGVLLATPGMFCFAINKITLAYLNAEHRMRPFAVYQAGRFVLMLLGLGVFMVWRLPAKDLPVLLSVGEIGILLLSIGHLLARLSRPSAERLRHWLRVHLDFGVRGVGSGMLIELSTRIDVMMLGVLSSDAVVGVYSFAAIFAEGASQLLIVIRNNYNPILVKLLAAGDTEGLRAMIRRGRNIVYPLMAGAAAAGVLIYWLGVPYVTDSAALQSSWQIFAILMIGIVLGAGYVPFGQLLLQAGRPGSHTLMICATVAVNAAGNALLIPGYGPYGAAIATAFSFVFAALALVAASRRLLGLQI